VEEKHVWELLHTLLRYGTALLNVNFSILDSVRIFDIWRQIAWKVEKGLPHSCPRRFVTSPGASSGRSNGALSLRDTREGAEHRNSQMTFLQRKAPNPELLFARSDLPCSRAYDLMYFDAINGRDTTRSVSG